MKLKPIVWSMTVVMFMIAMGNCYAAKRDVVYTADLPNGYSAHFKNYKGDNDSTLKLNGIEVCKLPDERYWMTNNNKELLCFMDNKNNIYVGLVFEASDFYNGMVLYIRRPAISPYYGDNQWVKLPPRYNGKCLKVIDMIVESGKYRLIKIVASPRFRTYRGHYVHPKSPDQVWLNVLIDNVDGTVHTENLKY